MASTVTKSVITIEGNNTPINFTNLSLEERVLDVNNFSFSWTPNGNDGSLGAIVQFKDDNLSKHVTISFNDENGTENHAFKGIITKINSSPNSDLHVTFHLSGSGMFYQINGKLECNSFYKQTLMDIINKVGSVTGATLLVNAPKDNKPIHYVVQYNQTAFDFIKTLAIRHGEWMYYTGDTLVFGGKPSGNTIKLKSGQDIRNINIHAHAAKANNKAFGFDIYKGEILNGNTPTNAPSQSALLTTANKAGKNVFVPEASGTYFSGAETQQILDKDNKLQQQATTAASVFITASSRISTLTVGSLVAVTDLKDSSGKTFVIVEIYHSADNNQTYNNHFTMIPVEVETPHYTNPWLCPQATIQPAIVVENEDKDGLDRIKVRFPWMKKSETTPWIQVLTPYAGKNKGFRWLPEKDEEVMIDFIENNVERPVMVGAMFTDKNKSGNKHVGNNVKIISTRHGRKLKMDDDKGTLELMDDDKSGNYIGFTKSNSDTSLKISSGTDDNNFSTVTLQQENKLSIGVKKGGSVVVSMEYDADSKKITIKSMGSIEISADQDITMTGNNITINALQKLSMEGKLGGVEIKGFSIKENADTTFEAEGKVSMAIKGTTVEVTGLGMAKLDGGGMTIVKGGIVMIN